MFLSVLNDDFLLCAMSLNSSSRASEVIVHVVVVLGDIGRSPRMCYHAASLAKSEHCDRVVLIGYAGEKLPAIVTAVNNISVLPLNVEWIDRALTSLRGISSLFHALVKGLMLLLVLIVQLFRLPRFRILLIQNPPALPVLFAAWVVCNLRSFFEAVRFFFSGFSIQQQMKNSSFNAYQTIIDWHNFGFTMYIERLGSEHFLVTSSRFFEMMLARTAVGHICVSNAMKLYLIDQFGLPRQRVSVLYDRPPLSRFVKQPLDVNERHELLAKLGFLDSDLFGLVNDGHVNEISEQSNSSDNFLTTVLADGLYPSAFPLSVEQNEWILERAINGKELCCGLVDYSEFGRSALVISSTSWTEDEDFTILLDALLIIERYLYLRHQLVGRIAANRESICEVEMTDQLKERRVNESNDALKKQGLTKTDELFGFRKSCGGSCVQFDRIFVVITGKGPLKEKFCRKVDELVAHKRLGSYVAVRTVWLEADDYPLLLRCADVGVSLHTSTSGLDLPMKVLDMFGSGVPVCAYSFPAISELVHHEENGLIFKNSEELSRQLLYLLCGAVPPKLTAPQSPNGLKYLKTLSEHAGKLESWEELWAIVMPIVMKWAAPS